MIKVEETTLEWVHRHFTVPKDVDCSDGVWRVMDEGECVLVVGAVRPSLVGWVELWVVVGKVKRSTFRARAQLIALVHARYSNVIAHTKGEVDGRFARFWGFRPIGPRMIRGEEWMGFELL